MEEDHIQIKGFDRSKYQRYKNGLDKYRDDLRKIMIRNHWDVSKLDSLPYNILDGYRFRFLTKMGAAKAIATPEEEVIKYRNSIRGIIVKRQGDVKVLDAISDGELWGHYRYLYRTQKAVAKAIMTLPSFREAVRKEVIRQGGDTEELDLANYESLEFLRSNYHTAERAAEAITKHYR